MRHMLAKPWSFVWGGFLVGLAEVVYFVKYGTPIPITTGLAKMFGAMEENVTGTDFMTRTYSADVHWIVVGIIIGASVVTLAERESKAWVRYPLRSVLLAFLGGAIFGFGTRIAQGCTTWHYLGGIPAMSLTSLVVALVSIPFAYLAFMAMAKLNVAAFMKHQEVKATVRRCVELGYQADTLGYDPGHKPHRDPVRIGLTAFFVLFSVSVVWTAFKGESPNSLGELPWSGVLIKGLAGFLLGVGIAKSGFGTECAVMAPKSLLLQPRHFEAMKVARITQIMFTGLMPFAGLLVAILMLNLAILITWIGLGWDVPVVVEAGKYKWGFHLGHLIGGPLLGIGSVLMIGCEIRTYARLGMGYLTGLAALPGFLAGYLPYTLYKEELDAVFFSRGFIEQRNMLELLPGGPSVQYAFAVLYAGLLTALLVWAIRKGSRVAGVTPREYISKSTDEVFLEGGGDRR